MLFLADCGVMPDPNVEQLASIAVQTGLVARQVFGTRPRIAMLSFSTKGSAKTPPPRRWPARLPLSANWQIVLELKLRWTVRCRLTQRSFPRSPSARWGRARLAGKANVLIFPDLNSGNIGAKLVQYLARRSRVSVRSCWDFRVRLPTCRAERTWTISSRSRRWLACRLSSIANCILPKWSNRTSSRMLSACHSGIQRRNSPSLNTTTPRIFIAATEQNTGKTTTSIGLYAALRESSAESASSSPSASDSSNLREKTLMRTAY